MDHDDAPLRLDLKGMKCPLPALHTRRALARAAPGAVIHIDCTDPMAAIDIPHLARQDGHVLEAQAQTGGVLSFRIRKGDGKAAAEKTGDGKAGAAG
ncbi:sulfurtransferase TusA family protein [Ancylobacter vacuolatus]|uniref:tRNA 2-thiouridine synthesizing protein A n=1 Tax=Ancylobacter vacuolatus TaxID=223389 RepID=A0ABU0DC00_9HYPH|nr:sulfurtransferase TusA family protein [Ancylobacter vacuolatus]MDQ0345935.1 tRNA 2-thiouridine synthesizing protein A [Ancylobacter vacuolatus]